MYCICTDLSPVPLGGGALVCHARAEAVDAAVLVAGAQVEGSWDALVAATARHELLHQTQTDGVRRRADEHCSV